MSQTVYRSSAAFADAPARTLVICCSASAWMPFTREFLAQGLHLADGSYDLLAVPGGGQLLLLGEYLPKFAWAGQKWVRFLVEKHTLTRAVVIAHQDCGWYSEERMVPAFLHGLLGGEPAFAERQRTDLTKIAAVLRGIVPTLAVEAYHAGRGGDGHVEFTREA